MLMARWFGRGKLLDVWSIPHFFFGVVAASFAMVFGVSFSSVFLGIIGLAVLWELFESWIGIREIFINRVADSILPLVGLALTYRFFESVPLASGHQSAVLFAAIFVFFLVNYLSWFARFSGEREFQG